MYELFIENFKVDIDQKLSVQLTFAIDDIANYGSRETSFSKTIVLPGTGRNNQIFGFIYDIASFNFEAPGSANIGSVFNAAQTSRAELRLNGLLVLKGVFRITNIIKDKDMIEYEGNLFGELGGFIAAIGAGKLEDLDFSVYNHIYNRGNIVNSWDNKIIKDVRVNFIKTGNINTIIIQNGIDLGLKINDLITVTNAIYNQNNGTFTVIQYVPPSATSNAIIYISESLANTNTVNDDITIEYTRSFGSGYYYPLIDYGTYSSNKINYDYRTFRPALYVKEYLDKIFEGSGYTYESSFLNSDFFKKLIIPNNSKQLKGFFTDLLDVKTSLSLTNSSSIITETLQFNTENLKRSFTGNGNPDYTYTGSNESLNLNYKLIGVFGIFSSQAFFKFSIIKNTTIIKTYSYFNRDLINQINIIDNINLDVATNDKLIFEIQYQYLNGARIDFQYLKIKANNPISTDVQLGNNILINDIIPRNILQKDFFTWIMKMFNLYITEDKLREKHLLIEPYTDYWNLDNPIDWTYKVARDKAWNIKPMGMLNGRFFEYKYKDDNDFYNEGFKKKYNLPYGSILEDTKFQFAKEKQTIEIGFSPSVLIQYQGTDKVVTAIYKKSSGNSVDQEERMDSNIRIMMAKKMTGVTSWYIRNNDANANLGAALTTYGYAGHFDDPLNPTVDINFGANAEIYFDPATYPTANLFNTYWSGYIAEIVDKDSKLLSCHARLTPLDIAQLDFSKPIMIDGVLFRLNKIEDYDYRNDELVKVELLKIINYYFPCAHDWTKQNYTGTRFRNGDEIPQVTGTTAWANLTTPAWCYYNNDPASEATYGKLYNWYAINDPRGFAPFGYRVPANEDWDSLVDCLGGSSVAGGKMKSTTGWDSPNTGATNESGFNGLPGGFREADGSFSNNLGEAGYWWSVTEENTTLAWCRYLQYNTALIDQESTPKNLGFSVRLIKE